MLNHTDRERVVPAPAGGRDLLSGAATQPGSGITLPANGVLVIRADPIGG